MTTPNATNTTTPSAKGVENDKEEDEEDEEDEEEDEEEEEGSGNKDETTGMYTRDEDENNNGTTRRTSGMSSLSLNQQNRREKVTTKDQVVRGMVLIDCTDLNAQLVSLAEESALAILHFVADDLVRRSHRVKDEFKNVMATLNRRPQTSHELVGAEQFLNLVDSETLGKCIQGILIGTLCSGLKNVCHGTPCDYDMGLTYKSNSFLLFFAFPCSSLLFPALPFFTYSFTLSFSFFSFSQMNCYVT